MLNTKINFVSVLVFIFLGLFNSIPADSFAVSYYIAANGNDGNNGTNPATPWLTISKVNSSMALINAGDQILFRRGDKFFGEVKPTKSGISGNNIVFGSYGSGELPEITGKKNILNWTLYSGNIYKAAISDTITQLYFEKKLLTIARYPNSGFLFIDNGSGTTGFNDAALTEASGYWNGANCRVRTVNWAYETKTVSAFSSGNITFSSATTYATYPKYGYYFDNKLFMLDTAGEWFHDKSTGSVYLYALGGVNPNTYNVEGVGIKNGFTFNPGVNYVTVQDLKITGFKEIGLQSNTNNYITIQRCIISQTGVYGISLNGNYNTVDNNILTDNYNSAVVGNFSNGSIKNNTIKRTGLIPGYGGDIWGYMALQIYDGPGAIIENNTIDSSGYDAVSCRKNMIIRNNIISYSCLTLNDGAGIEIDDTDGMQVINNIVTFTIGNTISSPTPKYAMGIYFGAGIIKNALIQGNTLANNNYAGINVDNKSNSFNNQILDNICYNNAYSQIIFTDISGYTFTSVYNNIVKRNIYYCLNAKQTCMEQQMFHFATFSDFGDFDSNYYCNPYTEYVFRKSMVYGTYSTKYYRLQNWKSNFNEDLNSKFSNFSFDEYKILNNLSANLIVNPRFQTNILPWGTTPSPGSNITQVTNSLLDTGCMRVRWNGVGSTEGMTSSDYINIVKGDIYSLSFSVAGNHTGNLNTFGRPKVGGKPFFYPRRFFSFENYRKNYSFTFRADTSDPLGRISFLLFAPDSLMYLDNVYLYKVNAEKIDSSQKSKLFTNNTNTPKSFSLYGITYKDLDGTIVTGSITVSPFASKILINDNAQIYQTLNLTVLMQGFYNESSDLLTPDSMKVYLRNNTFPYSKVDSATSVLNSTGNSFFNFVNAQNNTGYYLELKHRNSIETWSNTNLSFSDNALTFNFSTSGSQAYGNNQIQKGQKFCFYSGDVNNDGTIDGSDVSLVENDVNINASGYLNTDLTGDNTVDASDLSIIEYNADNSVVKITP